MPAAAEHLRRERRFDPPEPNPPRRALLLSLSSASSNVVSTLAAITQGRLDRSGAPLQRQMQHQQPADHPQASFRVVFAQRHLNHRAQRHTSAQVAPSESSSVFRLLSEQHRQVAHQQHLHNQQKIHRSDAQHGDKEQARPSAKNLRWRRRYHRPQSVPAAPRSTAA